jgi:chemotaxis protein CheD
MKKKRIVGIGGYGIARKELSLVTYGLGSCVAVIIYDEEMGIGGMAHIMLPDGKMNSTKSHPYRFPDTAIPKLLTDLLDKGAKREKLKAKLVGGSNMFSVLASREAQEIGKRNVEACREVIADLGIPIIAEDVGGDYGRTVFFCPLSGKVVIRSFKAGEKEI